MRPRAFSDRLESLRDPVGLKMIYSCSVRANRQAGCEHTRSDFALVVDQQGWITRDPHLLNSAVGDT